MMMSFVSGFGLGISLILAIGSQNAFVLRQGLRQERVFLVCLICALSDAILICAGVFGLGLIADKIPKILPVITIVGVTYLSIFALTRFYSAFNQRKSLVPDAGSKRSMLSVALACLAFTWLNPHVYLDTVFLLGSVSTSFPSRELFALGAIIASFVFFFSLGYFSRFLTPLFVRPLSWRILDFLIACFMVFLAFKLAFLG